MLVNCPYARRKLRGLPVRVQDVARRSSDQLGKRAAIGLGHGRRLGAQAQVGIELPKPAASAGLELAEQLDQLALFLKLDLRPDMADEAACVGDRGPAETDGENEPPCQVDPA